MLGANLKRSGWAIILLALNTSGSVFGSNYQQGELVLGQVEPGTQVWLDDVQVQVSPTGLYAFGLGRNASPNVILKTRLINKETTQVSLVVKKTPLFGTKNRFSAQQKSNTQNRRFTTYSPRKPTNW